MSTSSIFLSAYAIFLFIGAFMGLKAGSKVSLIMGLVSGVLVLLGVCWIKSDIRNGYLFLTLLNGLLTIVFVLRLLKTKSFMPSGMLLMVSLAVFVFCLTRLMNI